MNVPLKPVDVNVGNLLRKRRIKDKIRPSGNKRPRKEDHGKKGLSDESFSNYESEVDRMNITQERVNRNELSTITEETITINNPILNGQENQVDRNTLIDNSLLLLDNDIVNSFANVDDTDIISRNLPEEKWTMIRDSKNNIGATRMIDSVVNLISLAEEKTDLIFLAAYNSEIRDNSIAITVKVVGTQVENDKRKQKLITGYLIELVESEENISQIFIEVNEKEEMSKRNVPEYKDNTKTFSACGSCKKACSRNISSTLKDELTLSEFVYCRRCSTPYHVGCIDRTVTRKRYVCDRCATNFNTPIRPSKLLENPCSFDSFLSILCSHSSEFPNFWNATDLSNDLIRKIRCSVELINNGFIAGKDYCVTTLAEFAGIKLEKNIKMNMYGSEDANYLNTLKNKCNAYRKTEVSKCSSDFCSKQNFIAHSTTLSIPQDWSPDFSDPLLLNYLITEDNEHYEQNCHYSIKSTESEPPTCSGIRSCSSTYDHLPWMLPFEIDMCKKFKNIQLKLLPKTIQVFGKEYALAGSTLSEIDNGHFTAMIYNNGKWFYYNDLSPNRLESYQGQNGKPSFLYYFRT